MRFLISEFEQLFAEAALRKGLRLLRRHKPVLVERHGNHYGYEVADRRISLERTSIEIDHCHCECTNLYCEHLAALLFSFLDPDFDKTSNKKLKKQKAYSKSGALFIKYFAVFRRQWKELCLEGADTPSGLNRYVLFLEKSTDRPRFSRDLAALAALSLPGIMALSVESVRALSSRIVLRHFTAQVRKSDEEVMYLALLEMCRTNDRLGSGQFSALLPVFLVNTSNMFHLEELRVTFAKRQLRKYHSDLFDELQVAKLMLIYRRQQLEGKTVLLHKHGQPERTVARVRLHFASQELEAGWNLLDKLKKQMHESMPLNYFDFLNYLINISAAVDDAQRQLLYTEELVLNSPYLSSALAVKYLDLLPAGEKKPRVLRLMAAIRASRSEGAADKIFVLSMSSGYIEDFLQLASRQNVKFHLLHDLLMKHGVPADESILRLYLRHLEASLLQSEFQHSRIQMLEMAAVFMEKLPTRIASVASAEVLGYLKRRPALRVHEKVWMKSWPQARPVRKRVFGK